MMRTMEPCGEESVFKWIANGREPFIERKEDEPWPGCRVSNLLPDVFESYAKVLHRIDARYDYIDNPLSPEEERLLGIPQRSPIRALILERRGNSDTRVRWKEVAEVLGVPFAAGITHSWFHAVGRHLDWPRYLSGPGEGYLEEAEYEELVRLLSQQSGKKECYFRLAEIPYVATEQPLLFHGSLDEVRAIPVQRKWDAPEYWWSADCDWCICSDYDLVFTIVAGSSELVARVLANTVLEAIEVRPDMRIDNFAPMPV